ncbi:endo alpha-1,4 polygalactosaminidase [Kaistia geumhonensis]|uniref:Glycoside-hydrolase family GH114 TIM-barrel domain-containing protein n=1 Tax=Kaistia geumhonensis TaxID=410839 RepID=A0ABU0MBG9_9HYPH|nr:endo alpha-1,4 polygalactosaminidase [Kaistia geumhonensis]MCX5481207.1 endo alpha-1,4 polygalactosaminidase [Kaistia geumhonensis]MDQ0518268.1 hypothetical protein [Kaistia geumhonensis]
MNAAGIVALLALLGAVLGVADGRAESGRPAWTPRPDQTWHLQLQGTVETRYDADVYDIDLVDTPQATIDALHRRGRFVVCYFSAGSSEDFRSDFGLLDPSVMGRPLDGWPGERWLDIRSPAVRRFMTEQRLDLAVAKDCDGVDPDNVDGHANGSGFPLTAEDQLAFNRFLASEAHRRHLKVGLKNDLDQVAALAGHFDFAVNEQCHAYGECAMLRPFAAAGKPIFNVEYRSDYRTDRQGARKAMCASARAMSMRSLVLPLALDDSFRFACD